jgi:predicted DNA-binding transcriptional regulator AlpA
MDTEFLTERQLADWLGIAEVTLRTQRVRGDSPPHVRVGRLVRYRRCDVESWLAARTVGSIAKGG